MIRNLELTSDAPKWRYISSGTNIEGYCENQNCEAFKRMVIYRAGLGEYDIIYGERYCPLCETSFKPI